MTAPQWLVGGLGDPHDTLTAATLRGEGRPARPVGPLDADALDRGRALLPRGQCAPILYTTGALARAAERASGPLAWITPRSCGPCRFALFDSAWSAALARAPRPGATLIGLDATLEGLVALLSPSGAWRVLDAIVVADVLREATNRLRPHAGSSEDLDRRAAEVCDAIAARVEVGAGAIDALREEAAALRAIPRRPSGPLARAQLVGDPWSLHVEGDGQLDLPRVLAAAGVEVDQPPFALWIDYLAWQSRTVPFGAGAEPTARQIASAHGIEARLRDRLAAACEAIGLTGFELPGQDALADLATPHLSPGLRGGYGHLELALALRARDERRAHVVFSVKSFGCVPSSGVSDAIVPAVLGPELPFLSLEVSGDAEAARESRIALRVGSALDAAERELAHACRRAGRDPFSVPPVDPWSSVRGPRPYACTLACLALEAA